MTLVCILVLFRYANKDSVVSSDISKSTAKTFAFYVFLLTVVPPIIAFIEFVRMLRYVRDVCNCKKDYKEEKESFGSSENSFEKKKDESVDFLKDYDKSEESLVEKEITMSSEDEDGEPLNRVSSEPDSGIFGHPRDRE